MSSGVAGFIVSMGLSLLPPRYRRRWLPGAGDAGLAGPTMVSAVAISVVSIALLVLRFINQFDSRAAGAAETVINAPGQVSEIGARYFVGVVGTLNFILDPFHAFLACMAVDGAVRLLARISHKD